MHSATRSRWQLPALLVALTILPASLHAAIDPLKLKVLRQQAETHEQQAEWDKACLIYEAILRLERNAPGIHERYVASLRRYWQARRHADLSYRKEVLSLDYAQSLRLYSLIRDTLLENALDKKKTLPAQLFQKGLEEFDNALADPYFLQLYLPAGKLHEVRNFRSFLKKTWAGEEKLTRSQVLKQVREVALAAQNVLQLSSNVVLMELACGACYAFDDYTLYLTPNQLRELCDSLRGEYAGVGLTLRVNDGKVVIHEVAPYSPAAEINNPPLAKDDLILSIDKKSVAQMSPEAVQELLEGPVGTLVELEVYSTGMPMRSVTLRRRAMYLSSVAYHMKNERVAYLHIACFQDTTVQEIEDALAALGKADMKALVLDLRGNSGGVFEAAIDVARRFLVSGIIASTQNSDPKQSVVYQARNPNASNVPLVLLINGDTASAAEVLAGALKDNKRARLVGQTTFGKGCTQCILKLPSGPGGIPTGGMRLTVAKFFSPEGVPYSGRGVTPHVFAETLFPGSMNDLDAQVDAAVLEAQRLLDSER